MNSPVFLFFTSFYSYFPPGIDCSPDKSLASLPGGSRGPIGPIYPISYNNNNITFFYEFSSFLVFFLLTSFHSYFQPGIGCSTD